MKRTTRRGALKAAVGAGATLGLGQLGLLEGLPPVSADEAKLDPNRVCLGEGIEPLVRLLETTSRDRLLEEVAARVQSGTSYREVLAALLLAAVRNVQPRPSVGYKFHAVLVINSAHLASLSGPDEDRWLPIFWALDYYKAKQLEEESTSGWKLQPVDESRVPRASRARKEFVQAMESWDPQAADAAVAGLARSAGAHELFELFCRYGARDYRSIGHKAIFVANSFRTLQCIGWQHAEPVLRSLAYALLNHHGEPKPSESDLRADRPWRRNEELSKKIRADWRDGKPDPEATREMLGTLHDGSYQEVPEQAVELLNRGVAPQAIWDAVLVGAGELLMRQPGIIGLHSVTGTNALHYAFQTTSDEETRRMLLLQNCAFLPMYRESAESRGKVRDTSIKDLAPAKLSTQEPEGVAEEIFDEISRDRQQAAAKVMGYLEQGGSAQQLMDGARRLIFLKGRDAHDYKFSSAVLEDYDHVSQRWRSAFLALSVFNLRGSGHPDSGLVERTRQALES